MVMTSGQHFELTRLLERHPAIREHVDPLWKLKRLQPAELVDLAAALGIDVAPLLGPEWIRSAALAGRPAAKPTKKKTPAPAPSTPEARRESLRLVGNQNGADGGSVRVVTSNSDDDIRRHRAMSKVRWALVELAANMLRVIRGAGRPHEIGEQTIAVLTAMETYRKDVGFWPDANEISDSLSFYERPNWFGQISPPDQERWYAERTVMRGALQSIASSLLGQRTQETAGHHEMYQGINEIGRLRAEERARWAAEIQASRADKRRAKKSTRKPAKPPRKTLAKAAEPPDEG